ncbi:MAG: TetR/AcrR family transcriptional regulator, partial [Actinomycetales bacterium]
MPISDPSPQAPNRRPSGASGGAVRRRGRPPAAERQARRTAALEAARAELTESGYEGLTMARVALRAGSSKESLYTWFGSKQQLLAELIQEQAASTTSAVRTPTTTGWPADPALEALGGRVLTLLTTPPAHALKRAAMSSPARATSQLQLRRRTTGP